MASTPGNENVFADGLHDISTQSGNGNAINEGIGEESIRQLQHEDTKISFQLNPHRTGKKYEVFQKCLDEKDITTKRAKELEASLWDLKQWYKNGAIHILVSDDYSDPDRSLKQKIKKEAMSPDEKIKALQNRK